jgi:hypothetical protein
VCTGVNAGKSLKTTATLPQKGRPGTSPAGTVSLFGVRVLSLQIVICNIWHCSVCCTLSCQYTQLVLTAARRVTACISAEHNCLHRMLTSLHCRCMCGVCLIICTKVYKGLCLATPRPAVALLCQQLVQSCVQAQAMASSTALQQLLLLLLHILHSTRVYAA